MRHAKYRTNIWNEYNVIDDHATCKECKKELNLPILRQAKYLWKHFKTDHLDKYILFNKTMSLSLRSNVWDQYIITGNIATCKKCKQILKFNSACQANLWQHMKTKSCQSTQTRIATGGNSSPVITPLALLDSNSDILPLVPTSNAMKNNVGTAPTLPSPVAILPDQPCVEDDVSLTAHKGTFPQQLIEFMKTDNPCLTELPPDANATQTTASKILRLTQNLNEICGLADSLGLFNHVPPPTWWRSTDIRSHPPAVLDPERTSHSETSSSSVYYVRAMGGGNSGTRD